MKILQKFLHNSFAVADNLVKIPSSATRISSSLTNHAPRDQLRGWKIVQTHNMILDRLGNIYSFEFCFFVKIKWTGKNPLNIELFGRITHF